jgi:hypothetical protein
MGRSGGSFSVMTNDLMARFLEHLSYEVITKGNRDNPPGLRLGRPRSEELVSRLKSSRYFC